MDFGCFFVFPEKIDFIAAETGEAAAVCVTWDKGWNESVWRESIRLL